MSEVKRYTESCMEGGGVAPDYNGEFVEWKDYEKIRAELAALKAGQGEAVAYAYEYGKDNGDGSFSVTITRGQIPPYLTPVKDWPVKPLYLSPPASADARLVPVELLHAAARLLKNYQEVIDNCHSSELERFDYQPDVQGAADELRALLAQSESQGVKS